MSRGEERLFREAWPSVGTARRRQVVQMLVQVAEADVRADFNAIFRFCLGDEDEVVRALAVDGLWEDVDTRLIGPLLRLLRHDPAVVVRAAAAISLGRYVLRGELGEMNMSQAMAVQEALLECIFTPDEDLDVRRRAVESVAYSSDEAIKDIIEMAYDHSEESMRISAVFAMGRNADGQWREIVLYELDSSNPAMRYEAARACGELEILAAVPRLGQLVGDADSEVRQTAVWALGQIGGHEARRILEVCCEADDEALQVVAEEALGELEFMEETLDIPLFELDDDMDLSDYLDE